MGNRQVAAELFISIKTVQFHLTHIYAKLDISTRAELAAQFRDTDSTDRTAADPSPDQEGERGQSQLLISAMHSARSRSQIATRAGVDPPALTPQESAVARLVALGMGNRQVAAELFISIKTVQFHLTHIYGKLDISTRAELAAQFLDDDTTDRTPPRRRGQDAFERKAKVEPYRGSAAFCGSSTAMPDSGARRLTKLESVVARLVALGKDDRQIAAELFVGIAAVQFYLTQIYTKLGVGSRAELLEGSATVPQLMDSPGVNIN
jgi:DNA-binding CsgD family transcriptional regulator